MGYIKSKLYSISDKTRTVLTNMAGVFIVKGAALVISLFTMPAYISFFNDQITLGLWFTVLSVLNWIISFDLGIGNGLRNHLTRSIAEKDDIEAKRYLSSAYASIGMLCIVIIVAFCLGAKTIRWNSVFNIQAGIVSADALLTTVIIVFTSIVAQMFFKLITSVLYAIQKSFMNNLLSLATSVILVCAVSVLPSHTNDENLICMAVVNTIATLFPMIVTTVVLFCGRMKSMAPSFRYYDFSHAKQVLSLGGIFFFVQIVYMVIMSTNEYLISSFLDNSYVFEYQVYYRLFALGGTIFAMAMAPVWSMVTKALTEKDYEWIKKLYKRLMLFAGFVSACEFLVIPFIQLVVNIWLGNKAITTNYYYCFVFAFLGSLMILNSVLSSIANGVGELKTQALLFGIGAAVKVPLSWLYVQVTEAWIGVVIANVLSMAIYCAIQPWCLKKHLLIKENKELEK